MNKHIIPFFIAITVFTIPAYSFSSSSYLIANTAVKLFDYIHSLDTEKLALKIKQSENELNKKNQLLIDRVNRLQFNTIDLDYLEEQLRLKTGFSAQNELIIALEE